MKGKFASFMPLYSIQAWKKFYGVYPFGYWWPNPYGFRGYATYQRRRTWHGVMCIKMKYARPTDPKSPAQTAIRGSFASGVKYWQGLTNTEKAIYNSYKYPTQMTGFNRFLHYYLKNLPY